MSEERWMRKYEKRKSFSGIYLITNKKENKTYVGQSRDIFERWHNHILHASNPRKYAEMYKDMRRVGLSNFSFRILHIVDDESFKSVVELVLELDRLEQTEIKERKTFYNILTTPEEAKLNRTSKKEREKAKDIKEWEGKGESKVDCEFVIYNEKLNKVLRSEDSRVTNKWNWMLFQLNRTVIKNKSILSDMRKQHISDFHFYIGTPSDIIVVGSNGDEKTLDEYPSPNWLYRWAEKRNE